MAKIPVEDRFRIHAEATSEEMGRLLALFTRMGLTNIGYELITDIRSFGSNGPRQSGTTEQAVLEFIKEHPTFAISELVAALKAQGRSSGSVYTAARILIAKKILRRLGEGNYQSTDVKALAPPKREPTRGRREHYEVSNHDLIWKHFKNRKQFRVSDVNALFEKEGRPSKSASSQLAQMVQAKLFKRIGEGEYMPAPKAVAKTAGKKNAPKSAASHALNGTAAAAETEVQRG